MSHQIPTELVTTTDRRFLSREEAAPELLKIVGVPAEWSQYVRVLDRRGDLALLHFVNTTVSRDDQSLNEEPLSAVGHVRGTIVDTKTCEIVCRSFPYTPEAVSDDAERLAKLVPTDLTDVSVFRACEGTVMRRFYHNGAWHLSTHRKIDASTSYWAGPTFGEMFEEVRQFKDDELDKDLCYVFLMSHNGNRLVYKIDTPQLMMVTVYSRSTGTFLATEEWGALPTGVVAPSPVSGVTSVSDLVESVDGLEQLNRFDRAGLIVLSNQRNPNPVKIVNPGYNSLRNARGNDPSLRTRYIQLRGSPEGGVLVKWFNDAEFGGVFDNAEDEVDRLVSRLHSMYIHRYVKKNFDQLPKEEFVTLQRCHTWHQEDRGNNIVTSAKVRELLNTTPTHYLLIMLNRMRRDERRAEAEAATSDDDIPELEESGEYVD